MITRNFNSDLEMSEQPEVVSAIKTACYTYWPELLSVTQAHKDNDRQGIDYWLEFPLGKMEALDVKVRKDDWTLRGDNRTACLELVSNTGSGKVGWTLDKEKRTDWVLFYYIETNSSHIYNARQLRSAVIAEMDNLKALGKPATQSTGGYQSKSLFVSHRDLGAAIYRHSHLTNTRLRLAA